MSWTPGPWWVDEDHADAVVCERGMVADMEIGCPREEWAANARLISKSPEMYELLKAVAAIRRHKVLGIPNPEDLLPCMEDARALLAEIDGEAG